MKKIMINRRVKMFIRMMVVSAVIMVFGATAFAASPPDAFMNEKIICIFNGRVGDGGSANTKEFVEVGLKPGKWSKASDTQWIYKVKSNDPVTNKKSDVAFSFIKMAKLPNVEDSGVVLERVVENKVDLPPINVYNLCRQIYYSLPSLNATEKKVTKKAKTENVQTGKSDNKSVTVKILGISDFSESSDVISTDKGDYYLQAYNTNYKNIKKKLTKNKGKNVTFILDSEGENLIYNIK